MIQCILHIHCCNPDVCRGVVIFFIISEEYSQSCNWQPGQIPHNHPKLDVYTTIKVSFAFSCLWHVWCLLYS